MMLLLLILYTIVNVNSFWIKAPISSKNGLFYKKSGSPDLYDEDFDDQDESISRRGSFPIDRGFDNDKPLPVAKRKRPVILNVQGKWKTLNRAVLAGIFVAGMGTGPPYCF